MKILNRIISLALVVLILSSCSDEFLWPRSGNTTKETENDNVSFDNLLGNYLAGQLALLRNDYGASSVYLSKAYEFDPNNKELLNRLYMIYTATGNIEKAAAYADLAEESGQDSNTTGIVKTVNHIAKAEYEEALKSAENIKGEIKKLIYPTVKVWALAGQGKQAEAFSELEIFNTEKNKNPEENDNNAYYTYNKAMLYEYFSMPEEAKTEYENYIKISGNNLSFYNYSAIMEFYIRNGYTKEAKKLSAKTYYTGNTQEAKSEYTKQLLSGQDNTQYHVISPQTAVSDMLMYISSLLSHLNANPEMMYFYMRMAAYINPDNTFLQYLIAMHLDLFGLQQEAIKSYGNIKNPPYIKYASQLKIADIYIGQEEYGKAEDLLRKLQIEYPEQEELQLKLGDVLRVSGQNEKAFNHYKMLLKKYPKKYKNDWGIYYALGSTCDRGGNLEKAEKYMQKALELSKNNPIIQNHLGYLWLVNNKNISQAFELIAQAFSKAPHEAHIIDSMGWAFFKIGDVNRAILYLETAVAKDSGNALMNEHLGDAYWAGGRKNEAVFQWNHAMDLKEDAEEINREALQKKINEGLDYKPVKNYNYQQINKLINELGL